MMISAITIIFFLIQHWLWACLLALVVLKYGLLYVFPILICLCSGVVSTCYSVLISHTVDKGDDDITAWIYRCCLISRTPGLLQCWYMYIYLCICQWLINTCLTCRQYHRLILINKARYCVLRPPSPIPVSWHITINSISIPGIPDGVFPLVWQ